MKSTGITRHLDELGRIVLPKELRRTMHIEPKDELEIFIEEDRIVLKKYAPSCVFCNGEDGVTEEFMEKRVCRACIEKLKGKL